MNEFTNLKNVNIKFPKHNLTDITDFSVRQIKAIYEDIPKSAIEGLKEAYLSYKKNEKRMEYVKKSIWTFIGISFIIFILAIIITLFLPDISSVTGMIAIVSSTCWGVGLIMPLINFVYIEGFLDDKWREKIDKANEVLTDEVVKQLNARRSVKIKASDLYDNSFIYEMFCNPIENIDSKDATNLSFLFGKSKSHYHPRSTELEAVYNNLENAEILRKIANEPNKDYYTYEFVPFSHFKDERSFRIKVRYRNVEVHNLYFDLKAENIETEDEYRELKKSIIGKSGNTVDLKFIDNFFEDRGYL